VSRETSWHPTACILCSINCGIEVQISDGRFTRIRGDKAHPSSRGYLCQKAARLDYYQNHARRLRYPQRRRPDGNFERIDWDTAIREVADRLKAIRDTHGGHAIAYYGGGGQGNHIGGSYAVPFRAGLRTPYIYNSLAQEKTGDFWVNGRLFGRQTCHLTEDLEESDYAIIIGANPWQAHGIPRARKVIQAFRRDPKRTLVVIDPRRTVTAEYADIHLQVRPGTDAFLLAAMLGVIVQEGLEDRPFLDAHTRRFDELQEGLLTVPVDDYARRSRGSNRSWSDAWRATSRRLPRPGRATTSAWSTACTAR
jgi:anaerobic selenocysteine-containing dehydrogenase